MAIHPSVSCTVTEYLIWGEVNGEAMTALGQWDLYLAMFKEWSANRTIDQVQPQTLIDFHNFLYSTNEYRFGKPEKIVTLDRKTAASVWQIVSSYWNWVALEYGLSESFCVRENNNGEIVTVPIAPLTTEEVQTMIDFLQECEAKERSDSFETISVYQRNLALLIVLLSTGMTADEVCRLDFGDVSGKVDILTISKANRTTRRLGLNRAASKVMGKHMVSRITQNGPTSSDPLFVISEDYQRMDISTAERIVSDIGEQAGVKDVTVGRIRHTFAVGFLKMGGRALELEYLLGHENSKTYIQIRERELTSEDIRREHAKASPADNWRL